MERHEEQPRHVERGDAGTDQRGEAEDPWPPTLADERGLDDLVLGPEAGEGRHAEDGQPAQPERDPGDLHGTGQVAEPAHVDLVVHAMHDRAGAEEHAGLEEPVVEQVEDREGVTDRAQPGGEHHVADLTHRRGRECLLDVVLGAADDRPEQQGDGTDDDHERLRGRRCVEDHVAAHHKVDTGGDHRRCVDQRGHRCRAGHRVAQPALQGELRRLAAGCQQQHQADRREGGLVCAPDRCVHT